jgi:cation transport ATPase
MSELEMKHNRDTVQAGLDKKKAKRKKAEEEAYQESIEREMIAVVNSKHDARKAEEQARKENALKQAKIERENRIRNKKIANAQEQKGSATFGVFISLAFFIIIGICYITEITPLWNLIAATALSAIMFILNGYFVISNTIKLTRLA